MGLSGLWKEWFPTSGLGIHSFLSYLLPEPQQTLFYLYLIKNWLSQLDSNLKSFRSLWIQTRIMVRLPGFEPGSSTWQAEVLNQARLQPHFASSGHCGIADFDRNTLLPLFAFLKRTTWTLLRGFLPFFYSSRAGSKTTTFQEIFMTSPTCADCGDWFGVCHSEKKAKRTRLTRIASSAAFGEWLWAKIWLPA